MVFGSNCKRDGGLKMRYLFLLLVMVACSTEPVTPGMQEIDQIITDVPEPTLMAEEQERKALDKPAPVLKRHKKIKKPRKHK